LDSRQPYSAIVLGVSAGGMAVLKILVQSLPASFDLPIVIVQHLNAHSDNSWINLLNRQCKLRVKEADEKESIESGTIYIAPPNYHTLIESNKTVSFTIGERVNYARPSIDVLFESGADAYKNELIGIILTGSSNDGAKGLKRVKEKGGLAIVQDPATAESGYMPASAIALTQVDYILPLEQIIELLVKIDQQTTKYPI
jgi:two-component system, chemotaxis family, protein-glutamate methylesterase/glutaminase